MRSTNLAASNPAVLASISFSADLSASGGTALLGIRRRYLASSRCSSAYRSVTARMPAPRGATDDRPFAVGDADTADAGESFIPHSIANDGKGLAAAPISHDEIVRQIIPPADLLERHELSSSITYMIEPNMVRSNAWRYSALPSDFRSTRRSAGRGFDCASGRHAESIAFIRLYKSAGD